MSSPPPRGEAGRGTLPRLRVTGYRLLVTGYWLLLFQVPKQRPDHHSRSARRPVGPVALDQRRAGDVEVGPGDALVDEFAQEERRRDGATPAAARVLHVGHVALDHLHVLVLERH